jgi:hypothetical protein
MSWDEWGHVLGISGEICGLTPFEPSLFSAAKETSSEDSIAKN